MLLLARYAHSAAITKIGMNYIGRVEGGSVEENLWVSGFSWAVSYMN